MISKYFSALRGFYADRERFVKFIYIMELSEINTSLRIPHSLSPPNSRVEGGDFRDPLKNFFWHSNPWY
jgi:hypothetical protein